MVKPKTTNDTKALKILLWGRPNVGKTIAGCSASAFFDPEKLGKEKQVLKDVFLVGVEDGVASLRNLKLEVPNWFDLTEHMQTQDGEPSLPVLERAQAEVFSFIRKNAGDDTITIYDSITAFDTFAAGFYGKHVKSKTDKYAVLNAMAGAHMDLSVAVATLPGTVVVTGHGKAQAPIDNDDTLAYKEAKAKVSGLGEKHYYTTLAVTGNNAQHYWRNFNEIYAMDAKSKRIKGVTVKERVLHTEPTAVMEAKTKHSEVLNAEEPANLRAIMRKIGVVK